jgi:hypothetical protein
MLYLVDEPGLPEQKTVGYVQFSSHSGDSDSEEPSGHATRKRDATESGDQQRRGPERLVCRSPDKFGILRPCVDNRKSVRRDRILARQWPDWTTHGCCGLHDCGQICLCRHIGS